MRTVVNLLATLKPKTGVGHYAARLYDALQRRSAGEHYDAFPTGRLASIVGRLHRAAPAGRPVGGRLALSGRAAGLLKRALRSAGRGGLSLAFRAACRRREWDLYHEPNFIPFASDLRTVVTVHDLSVLLHPEWHPADRVRDHQRCFRAGVAAGHHIITVSQFIRGQVLRYLGVAPDRVSAVPNGVGPEYFAVTPEEVARTRTQLGLPEGYLLSVGTIEPRKNILTLLRAYCGLSEAVRRRCPLVLAGGWGWKSADVAEFIAREAAAKNVLHIGYTDDRQLPGLYAGARALAYPSHYEGFGLPPLEMLACGGAVLASTADAHREVLGPHAHFVEPTDEAGWREALSRAILDDDWLAIIRRGGRERARRFTWQRCADETAAVYWSALRGTRRAA